jgi:hypothetical protein
MGAMKTPGVYIVEKNAFPNSVVEVETAVPAFIGYTEKADNKGKSLLKKPWKISSMIEFIDYYGGEPIPALDLKEFTDEAEADITFPNGKKYVINRSGQEYIFYYCIRMFFENGGGPCYIVSMGDYSQDLDPDRMKEGIKNLIKEQEPTMVVIPEAIKLKDLPTCISVQQASLMHCGDKMKNRVSILDIYGGSKDRQDPDGDCIDKFRNALGINNLDYSAAYYPWLNTTILQEKDINYFNITEDGLNILKVILEDEFIAPIDSELALLNPGKAAEGEEKKELDPDTEEKIKTLETMKTDQSGFIEDLINKKDDKENAPMLNKALTKKSKNYGKILTEMTKNLNLLPPAAAMAGIYTKTDNSQGVWKAPANVSLNSVVSPAVNISHDDQEDLNVTIHGKSINAIRTFIGEGTLVWGARTLDGNSLDWRYVNVRRTMIMLEESIKNASKAYVFESNNANTWITMKSMIRNFLTGIWKRGGLAGSTPEDAFSVHVGLGETMTPEDILEGILRITVLVAITRPAEFIEITFQQQMQKS